MTIVTLHRERMTQARIGGYLLLLQATVGRVITYADLGRLFDPVPTEPAYCYKQEWPGELIHIDIKKLGRTEVPGIVLPVSR